MKNLLKTLLILSISFSCESEKHSTRIYDGKSKSPDEIGVLYSKSVSKIIKGNPTQAASRIIKLTNTNGKDIKVKNKIELKTGKYSILLIWELYFEDKDKKKLFKANKIRAPKPYKILFSVKEGMTYVVDLEPTITQSKNAPNKICIVEEHHNSVGAKGPKFNKALRYPSNKASIIACGEMLEVKIQDMHPIN